MMAEKASAWKVAVRKAGLVVLAAIVTCALTITPNTRAEAAQGLAAATSSSLAVQAASYEKTAVANAKTIIKKAGATSGTTTAKLKKVYTYIAKDKSFKGVYQFGDLRDFYVKYGNTYYSMLPKFIMQKSLYSKYYKKYAVDMYKEKKGSCFHYAALFGVTAKQLLGKSAIVKLAVGPSQHTGKKIDYHAWVEVTMNKKTYIYDPQAGNTTAKSAKKATSFGKYCGTLKTNKALKANYYNYKGNKYVTVKL